MTVAPVTLAVLIAATLIIALLPLALYRYLRKPLSLDRRDSIVGIAVFALFAMVLQRGFHGVVLGQVSPGGWLTQPLAFVAYGALSAGVFEEVGRYLGMRFLTRRYGASAGDGRGIGNGLGHGGAEAWFAGVLVWGQWSYLAWLANHGQLDAQLAGLPGDAVLRLHVLLSSLSVQSIALLLIERRGLRAAGRAVGADVARRACRVARRAAARDRAACARRRAGDALPGPHAVGRVGRGDLFRAGRGADRRAAEALPPRARGGLTGGRRWKTI